MLFKQSFESSKIQVEIEAQTVKELFEKLSPVQEVLGNTCQKCDGEQGVVMKHRKVKQYDYYELNCLNKNCNAKLSFGIQMEDKSLFPIRYEKDEKGQPVMKDGKKVWLSNSGWQSWDAKLNKMV